MLITNITQPGPEIGRNGGVGVGETGRWRYCANGSLHRRLVLLCQTQTIDISIYMYVL